MTEATPYCQSGYGVSSLVVKGMYRGSPDSTVFAPPGNRTIEKTVLLGMEVSIETSMY